MKVLVVSSAFTTCIEKSAAKIELIGSVSAVFPWVRQDWETKPLTLFIGKQGGTQEKQNGHRV